MYFRLVEEDTFTRDEVIEILIKIRNSILDDLETELINFVQSNILILYQLFRQLEKWHLKLNVDLSEVPNKKLRNGVKHVEKHPVKGDRSKPKFAPLSTNIEKALELLRMEILNVTAENEQLQKVVNSLQQKILNVREENKIISCKNEEKNKVILELQESIKNKENNENVSTNPHEGNKTPQKTLENFDSVLKEHINHELEKMKRKVDAAQSQLTLAEIELEKKFNHSKINKKKEQKKDLRTRLQKYENLDADNDKNTE